MTGLPMTFATPALRKRTLAEYGGAQAFVNGLSATEFVNLVIAMGIRLQLEEIERRRLTDDPL